MSGPSAGLPEFGAKVEAAIGHITDFVQKVVIHRREFAIRGWRNWIQFIHLYTHTSGWDLF